MYLGSYHRQCGAAVDGLNLILTRLCLWKIIPNLVRVMLVTIFYFFKQKRILRKEATDNARKCCFAKGRTTHKGRERYIPPQAQVSMYHHTPQQYTTNSNIHQKWNPLPKPNSTQINIINCPYTHLSPWHAVLTAEHTVAAAVVPSHANVEVFAAQLAHGGVLVLGPVGLVQSQVLACGVVLWCVW